VRLLRALLAASLLVACGGGGDDDDDDDDAAPDAAVNVEVCSPPAGTDVYFDPDDLCDFLSSYRFFTNNNPVALDPNDRVVPYEMNTPLFSDYAAKQRYIYLPPGETMAYDDAASFDLPVGSAILKTFGFPERVIETRVLFHTNDGWKGVAYIWNDAQDEAEKKVAGGAFEIDDYPYIVPNQNQCKECHEEVEDTLGPIGPKARNINRDFDYGGGNVNQLQHFVDIGFLTGAPSDPETEAPRAPVWDDDTDATLEQRAKAYLEINCAHCHNPEGRARTSGLDLRADNADVLSYGVCKPPVAAGGGSGGLQYGIVPGMPDQSILVFRMDSNQPDVQMPELGRSRVHTEGVALVREWITALEGSCPTPE